MAYNQLISNIKNYIKENGRQEITGQIMQDCLVAIIENLSKYQQFGGMAADVEVPDTENNVFYFAAEGTYPAFGNLEVGKYELAVFINDNGWVKETIVELPEGPQGPVGPEGPQGPVGPEGERGPQADNPFKGWYTSSGNLPANPSVGDYAYVKGANVSDPAKIYQCVTAGTWTDSGRTADTSNVQTFATGEQVNQTPIDDTNLANPANGSLPLAEDVATKLASVKVSTVGKELYEVPVKRFANGQSALLTYISSYGYVLDGITDDATRPKCNQCTTLGGSIVSLGLKVGDTIIVEANGNYATRFCFATSYNGGYNPATTGKMSLVTGTSLYTVNAGETMRMAIPAGTMFLFIRGVFWRRIDGVDYEQDGTPSVYIERSVQDLVDEVFRDETSIFEYNPDAVMEPRFLAMRKRRRYSGSSYTSEAVVFGHVSDCHGESTDSTSGQVSKSWNRVVDFVNHWKGKGYVDDMVDTGDIVLDYLINKRTNPNNTTTVKTGWRNNAENVLTVLGNHDTASAIKVGGVNTYDWTDNIGNVAYDKFIAPNVGNWNVTQPTGAAGNGYCYFYKDYVKRGYNESSDTQSDLTLRAIFVDVMAWGLKKENGDTVDDPANTQEEWVKSVLVDAANNGYYVVVFAHSMNMTKRRIDCSYSSLGASVVSSGPADINPKARRLNLIVAQFQRGELAGENTPGIFLGYVTGHRHLDVVSQATGIWDYTTGTQATEMVSGHDCINFDDERYPQLEFTVGAEYLNMEDLFDFRKKIGTKNEDNFQFVAFQMYGKTVRMMKIGCDIDVFARHKDMVSVSAAAINEFDPTDTSYTPGVRVVKDGVIYRLINPVVVDGETSWEHSDKVRSSRVLSEVT